MTVSCSETSPTLQYILNSVCATPSLSLREFPGYTRNLYHARVITFALGHSSFWWSRSLALSMVTPHSSHIVLECGHLQRCSALSEYVPCQSQPKLGHFILRLLICSLTALSGKVLLKVISVRSLGQTLLRELMTGFIHSKQNL